MVVAMVEDMMSPVSDGAAAAMNDDEEWPLFLDFFSLVSRKDQQYGARAGRGWLDCIEEPGKHGRVVMHEIERPGAIR